MAGRRASRLDVSLPGMKCPSTCLAVCMQKLKKGEGLSGLKCSLACLAVCMCMQKTKKAIGLPWLADRRALPAELVLWLCTALLVEKFHSKHSKHTHIKSKGKKKQTKMWLGPAVRGPCKHRKQPASFSFSTFTCTQQASRHTQPAELTFFPSVRPLTAVYG